jgi:sugar phosphate isomerase/epimerase
MKDEHLWPGEGTIDWPAIVPILATLPDTTPFILEPACDRDEPTDSITRKAENVFRSFADQQAALAASNL